MKTTAQTSKRRSEGGKGLTRSKGYRNTFKKETLKACTETRQGKEKETSLEK